jgi:single-strand DNA-binding protein
MLPTITGVGRLAADPELRFTPNGNAVLRVRLVFSKRRKNEQTQQWEDGDQFWVDGTAWQQLAEHCAETLTKGMEVLVSGEIRTETWDKDGQKHSKPSLLIRSIGPNLAGATAQVRKPDRQQPQQSTQRPQQPRQQPQNDPWATNGTPTSTGSGWSEEPPF